MTGRSLHDALLTVLSDGPLRAQLLTGDTSARGMLGREEWVMLRRVSVERLCRMARFLARHYYRERIVRLFRHIRTLAPHTGRDPLAVLDTPAGLASLDQSVLGTHATAERLVSLIEDSLIGNDAVIRRSIPYWRDLVRYHVTMFRVEAGAPLSGGNPGGTPRRTPSTRVLDLDWDIPGVIADLRKGAPPVPIAKAAPTCLLVARSRHGRITAVRCSQDIRVLVEAADGQRTVDQLARMSGLSVQEIGGLLPQLEEIGAIS
ncbi:MAG: hypothetical protein AUH74_04905 [Nitrospirae bacterium 13_1_40CM_4_62_6]|nr:MAG: hypothetical protein AUH74_04905 [Nitrospirae bacterium 13_1_40CM_4_62_6]